MEPVKGQLHVTIRYKKEVIETTFGLFPTSGASPGLAGGYASREIVLDLLRLIENKSKIPIGRQKLLPKKGWKTAKELSSTKGTGGDVALSSGSSAVNGPGSTPIDSWLASDAVSSQSLWAFFSPYATEVETGIPGDELCVEGGTEAGQPPSPKNRYRSFQLSLQLFGTPLEESEPFHREKDTIDYLRPMFSGDTKLKLSHHIDQMNQATLWMWNSPVPSDLGTSFPQHKRPRDGTIGHNAVPLESLLVALFLEGLTSSPSKKKPDQLAEVPPRRKDVAVTVSLMRLHSLPQQYRRGVVSLVYTGVKGHAYCHHIYTNEDEVLEAKERQFNPLIVLGRDEEDVGLCHEGHIRRSATDLLVTMGFERLAEVATRYGNASAIEYLLGDERTSKHIVRSCLPKAFQGACAGRQCDLVKRLLQKDRTLAEQYTNWRKVVELDYDSVLRIILGSTFAPEYAVVKEETPESCWTIAHDAATAGSSKCLSLILRHPRFEVDRQREIDLNTALHCAAEANTSECLRLLLEHGANPLIRNIKEETPRDIVHRRAASLAPPPSSSPLILDVGQESNDSTNPSASAGFFPTDSRTGSSSTGQTRFSSSASGGADLGAINAMLSQLVEAEGRWASNQLQAE
jgi:hypothetical protein